MFLDVDKPWQEVTVKDTFPAPVTGWVVFHSLQNGKQIFACR